MPPAKKNKKNKKPAQASPSTEEASDGADSQSASVDAGPKPSQLETRKSWASGTWMGKANAVAEIAKESIPGNTVEAVSKTTSALRSPSKRLSQSLNSPGKSNPSPASATPLHVTSDASSEDRGEGSSEKKEKPAQPQRSRTDEKKEMNSDQKDGPTTDGSAEEPQKTLQERPAPAPGWRGWWSRSKEETTASEKPVQTASAQSKDKQKEAKNTPETSTEQSKVALEQSKVDTNSKPEEPKTSEDKPAAAEETRDSPKDAKPQRSSWFGLWGSGNASSSGVAEGERRPSLHKGESVEASSTNVDAAPEPSKSSTQTAKEQLTTRPTSGSWAFWSREKPQSIDQSKNSKSETTKEVGELAVTGTESQSKPRPARLSQSDAAESSENSKKRQRPESSEIQPSTAKKKQAAKQSSNDSQSDGDIPPAMQQSVLKTTIEQPKSKSKKSSIEKAKKPIKNRILPPFNTTYPVAQPASYLSRVSRYIPYLPASSQPLRLKRSQQPHKIRHALAIGVHGYFPTALIQKVLGPPTGTSIKFADHAAAAIHQYCTMQAQTASIEKVALEGEGTVEERIESLWKLLLNWIDAIRRSDFILVACHSQGVPVAVGLVSRLLGFSCVKSDARVGICAMAGVNLGPFSSYQSRYLPLGSSGVELFEFAQPNSAVSLAYDNALNTCFRHNVRLLYVGSLDDQLVSLESSTFGTATHPYISRAVFVDGREHPHEDDFLTRLVGFALKLRNLGISDHGLIRELSTPLAGSLYSGEGHSRIYEEEGVYDLAVRLTAETETLDPGINPNLEVNKKPADGADANPFFLPWAIRGMLEEEDVKKDMKGETDELLGYFEKWRPQSKTLKDVRFRLEAVRSKL